MGRAYVIEVFCFKNKFSCVTYFIYYLVSLSTITMVSYLFSLDNVTMCSQNKCIINVKIPSFDQSTIYLTHNRNSSIESIKEKLEQQTGIPLDSQILSYSGYAIQDNASFEEIIQSNTSCIVAMSLDIAVIGGAHSIHPLSAPDMSSDECFEVKSFCTTGTSPSYNRISRGINFEAICRTSTCVAHNKKVDIQLGMCMADHGICHYAEAMLDLNCPACNKPIDYKKDITNVSFLNCTVKIRYKILDSTDKPQEYQMCAPADQYLILKDPKTILQYHYIKFSLK